jgi:4-hydroxy-2-oxoheptanedioate aldolase
MGGGSRGLQCPEFAGEVERLIFMRSNYVRHKLKRGEPSVGTWLTMPTAIGAGMMARTGFDWLTVELEHTPITFETAAASFAVISACGKVPLARVPWNTGENIKRVLDTGAYGVIVPMVNTRAEAEAVVAAARYAPLGKRSIGGQLHAANFETDAGTYYAKVNDEMLVVVMMETAEAIRNAEEILSVPGIDAFFVGPNDLHHSMGLPPAFDSDAPEFVNGLKRLLEVGRKYNVAPGMHVADAAAAQRRIAQGFQMIAVASETGMMLAKAAEITKTLGIGSGKAAAKY